MHPRSIKQKDEVQSAIKTIRKLDDLEMHLVMAVNNRSLKALRKNLQDAKDVDGKPFRRDILKAAEGVADSIKLEILAEKAISSRKVSEVKVKLTEVETALKDRPELAQQNGSKIEGISTTMEALSFVLGFILLGGVHFPRFILFILLLLLL